MPARKICAFAIISIFIFSFPLTAQSSRSTSTGIIIKDSVAITPKAVAGNFAVSLANIPVTFNFTWEPTSDPGFPFIIDVYHCKGTSRVSAPWPAGAMSITFDSMGYSAYTFYSQHATPQDCGNNRWRPSAV